jgi:hypothetical protein
MKPVLQRKKGPANWQAPRFKIDLVPWPYLRPYLQQAITCLQHSATPSQQELIRLVTVSASAAKAAVEIAAKAAAMMSVFFTVFSIRLDFKLGLLVPVCGLARAGRVNTGIPRRRWGLQSHFYVLQEMSTDQNKGRLHHDGAAKGFARAGMLRAGRLGLPFGAGVIPTSRHSDIVLNRNANRHWNLRASHRCTTQIDVCQQAQANNKG